MAGKVKGRTMLLKINDGTSLVPFGGMTAKSLSINGERIDATTPNPESPADVMWRETVDKTKSIDVSGDVTIIGDAAEKKAIEIAMQPDNVAEFEVIIPKLGSWTGNFAVNLEFSGEDLVTCSLTLSSEGAVPFTPEAAGT